MKIFLFLALFMQLLFTLTAAQNLPNVEGMNVDQAVQKLKSSDPSLEVVKMLETDGATEDMKNNRVRVYYDPQTKRVLRQPGRG